MSQIRRRTFLKRSLAASGATFFASGTETFGRILGANDEIHVGVAGIHGRGGSHIGAFSGMKGVRVTYLIDPDARLFPGRVRQVVSKSKIKPTTVQDIRKALDEKALDCVSVATPNHWHSLITIWACEAGKDVYVEKPCSHNVHEGRIAVETARKHRRIVQHGTQSRSGTSGAVIAELAKRGTYGKLLVSRGLCYKHRGSIGFKEAKTPPPQLDFDIWLGPATKQPYHENLVHYNWHWFWDFGNGDIGNQGVHQMDIARWAIPGATLPRAVISLGGRFGYKDQGQTANTQIAIFDYGDVRLMFEVRGLNTGGYYGQKIGNVFHFEEGVVAGGKYRPGGGDRTEGLPRFQIRRGPGGGHFANFIEAVRSRRVGDLNADILEGHLSSALCHLANISYRLGTVLPFDRSRKAFGDDKGAYEMLERMMDHLHDNGLEPRELRYRVGRRLAFDPEKERFVGDEEANALLTRDYRGPFLVPDRVV